MFSERFEQLCAGKGVKPGRACSEMGVSRSLAAKWKATKTNKPSADVLQKMSEYFGLSIDEILGAAPVEKAPAEPGGRPMTDEELKFALWGDCRDISDDDLADVLRYAAFVRERKKDSK